MEWLCYLLAGILVIVFIIMVMKTAKKKRLARETYLTDLCALEDDPTSPEKRMIALHSGRIYAELVRRDKGTSFDEIALMNDIHDACKLPENRAQKRLDDLKNLLQTGLITLPEYEVRREKILKQKGL